MDHYQESISSRSHQNGCMTRHKIGLMAGMLALSLSQFVVGQVVQPQTTTSSLRDASQQQSINHLITDVNRDGIQDLLVADPGQLGTSGKVMVYLDVRNKASIVGRTPSFHINIEHPLVFNLGVHMSVVRDYNQDGHHDLLVGGWYQETPETYAPVVAVWDMADGQLLGWMNNEVLSGIEHRQQLDLNENGLIDPDDLLLGLTSINRLMDAIGERPHLHQADLVYQIASQMYALVDWPSQLLLDPGDPCNNCLPRSGEPDETDPPGGGAGGGSGSGNGSGGSGGPGGLAFDCGVDGINDIFLPEGTPIEDTDGDGIIDACEIFNGAPDCNQDGIPDESQPELDCDDNGVLDECEEGGTGGSDDDCDGNGVKDSCELTGNDCNNNGVLDICEVTGPECVEFDCNDCDGDGILDDCEQDLDGNGVPDDCECPAPCLEAPLFMGDKDNIYIDYICESDFFELEWEVTQGDEILFDHKPAVNPYTGNWAYHIEASEDVSGNVTVQVTDANECVYSWTVTIQKYCHGQFAYRVGIPWLGLPIMPTPLINNAIFGVVVIGGGGDGPALRTDRMMVASDIAANGWLNFWVKNPAQASVTPSTLGVGNSWKMPVGMQMWAPITKWIAYPIFTAPPVRPSTVLTNVTLVGGPHVTGHLNTGVLSRSAEFQFELHGAAMDVRPIRIDLRDHLPEPLRTALWVLGMHKVTITLVPNIDGKLVIEAKQQCDPNTGMLPATYRITGGHDGFPAHRVFMTGQVNPVYSWIPTSPGQVINLTGVNPVTAGPVGGAMKGVDGECP